MKQSGKIYMRYQRQFPESTSNFHVYLDTFVELRLLIVKHFLLSTMEQCWEETMPPQMWSCWLHLCIMYCPMFVWESYLRCLQFQILYNELDSTDYINCQKNHQESIFIIYLYFVLCWYWDWSGISILYLHW